MQTTPIDHKREKNPDKDPPMIRRKVKPGNQEQNTTANTETPLYLQEEEQETAAQGLEQEPVETETEREPAAAGEESAEEPEINLQRQTDEEETAETTTETPDEEPELVKEPGVQAKYTIGARDDEHEQQADRVSDKVMRTPANRIAQPYDTEEEEKQEPKAQVQTKSHTPPYLQRLCSECEEEQEQGATSGKSKTTSIQKKSKKTGRTSTSSGLVNSVVKHPGGGSSVPAYIRRRVEPVLGADLGHVKVHDDRKANRAAQSINAKAFTHKNNIYLGKNQSVHDVSLMTHELTHTVQQGALKFKGVQRRKPQGKIRYVYGKVLSRGQVRNVKAVLNRTQNKIYYLEKMRLLTTDEGDLLSQEINRLITKVSAWGAKSKYEDKRYRYLRKHRYSIIKYITGRYGFSKLKKTLIKRRNIVGKDGKLVSNLKVTPPVIKIHEGEAAHISFNLKKTIKDGYALFSEKRSASKARIMPLKGKKLGYNYLIWTGYWGPSNPAETGTYWMNLNVSDHRRRSESLWKLIRVENKSTTLAVGMTPNIAYMKFDGKGLRVVDIKQNTMTLDAVSGIKRNHKLYNKCRSMHSRRYRGRRPDFTKSKYQWAVDCGPIPEHLYKSNVSTVQPPSTSKSGLLVHPRTSKNIATVSAWGPFRIALHPNVLRKGRIMRSGFFLHLDTKGDGTAGCIGIQPKDVGKLNMLFSLIRRTTKVRTILVDVIY